MTIQLRLIFVLAAACSITPTCTMAETVTVTASHARPGTGNKVTYETTCEDGTYRLILSRAEKKTVLQFQGPNGRIEDMSASSFATTTKRQLYGRFGYTCWNPGGINVFFFGFEMQRDAQPKPVSYRLTIDSSGRVVADYGVQPEEISVVNSHLIDD